jgi:hypothetical protein
MKDFSFEGALKREKRTKIIAGCLATLIVLPIVLFLGAAIGMWLWNAIMVPVFAMPVLGYWQMYGIMILAKLIFGGTSISSLSK